MQVASRLPNRSMHHYTYAQFYQRVQCLAERLTAAGLKRGDRVATLMWNNYAHLEAYFGIPVAGGVLHPLNLRLHPNEIAYIANHAEDRFLILDDALVPTYEKFKTQTKFERVFVVRHSGEALPAGYEDYDAWLQESSGVFQYPEIRENDGIAMCFTSGTTGNPKGVLYSHRALMLHSMTQGMVDSFAISRRDTIMVGSPLFHVNGWGLPFAAAMFGAKLVFPGPFMDAESLLDIMQSERVTFACAVPTVWLPVLAALEKEPGRWRLPADVRIGCGGTAPPQALIQGLDRHGIHIIHAWGMTETSPTASISPWRQKTAHHLGGSNGSATGATDSNHHEHDEHGSEARSKQGWALPFVEARIMTENGIAPRDGQVMGELEVRGPWVTKAYYNAPEIKDRWSADGWFRTGDVAVMEPDGCIRLVDRTKDLIKSGGEWISSVDLENALMSHPCVREAGVIAIPHPKWQERPLAVVILKEPGTATAEDLRSFLAGRFAKWQLPEDFVFVAELPHTSTGKLLKSGLRAKFTNWKWSTATLAE